MTAVVAAREARDPDGGGAIYTTRFAHYCVDKALQDRRPRRAPRAGRSRPTTRYRMDVAALEAALEADRQAGIRPWLVVASAGTVDTGAIDPLAEIADLCRRYGAWLHVDGAYGGLFALCDEGRERLRGIDQADSVALDPHKTLFLPYGTGAVLVREGRHLPDAFSATGRLHPAARRVRSRPVARRSVARADPPFPRDAAVAAAAARRGRGVQARRSRKSWRSPAISTPGWRNSTGSIPVRSRSSALSPSAIGDDDDFNQRLLAHLQQEGRVMLSGTRIDGASSSAARSSAFRTHLEHVDEAIDAILGAIAALRA